MLKAPRIPSNWCKKRKIEDVKVTFRVTNRILRSLLTWIRANPNAKPPTMWRWSLIQEVRLSIHPCVYITEEASVSCMYNINWTWFLYWSVLFLMIELCHKMIKACCGSQSTALWQCCDTKVTYKFLFPHWKSTVCVNLILLGKQKSTISALKGIIDQWLSHSLGYVATKTWLE